MHLTTDEARETYWRSLQAFNITRVVIACVLLAYLSFSNSKGLWLVAQSVYREVCIVYVIVALMLVILAHNYRRHFYLQLVSQVVLDIALISMLYLTAGGAKSGLVILYLFPLAGAAILAPQVLALFFVSLVTIFLLAESSYQLLQQDGDSNTMQAGLYGATFFAAVFVINRLAARLIRQEQLAIEHGKNLQAQLAINRLVIADMGDGILVVGNNSEIMTCNPAAEHMLGLALSSDIEHNKKRPRLSDIPSLMPIAEAFFAWKANPFSHTSAETAASIFLLVKPADDQQLQESASAWSGRRELASHLKLRFVPVNAAALTEHCAIIFLQDVSQIENQAQQLKLASMGRLTASIAHEVRNPLAAISHAAALMGEEAATPMHARLLGMVSDNVARVNRMIEDILNLSRKAHLHGKPIELSVFLQDIKEECEDKGILPPRMLELGDMGSHSVQFDPLHLREVLLNLLTNAVRYASNRAGSIQIHLAPNTTRRLELHVQDDGASITPEVRDHLFEPFYTTSSKGTGLGLYLARELCLNNDAMLDYEYRMEAGNEKRDEVSGRFVITFSKPGHH